MSIPLKSVVLLASMLLVGCSQQGPEDEDNSPLMLGGEHTHYHIHGAEIAHDHTHESTKSTAHTHEHLHDRNSR